jgi:microcystin-dependent protein
MADTFTANYNLTKPQIGGDSNTWGGFINANFDTLDTNLKAVSNVANAALPAATFTSNFPIGIIALWSGAANAIPAHWHLCDGTTGTPDLRDRFVVGAGNSYAVGATGGAATVALTTAQLPAHNHPVYDPGHAHSVYDPTHSHGVYDPGHGHGIQTWIAGGSTGGGRVSASYNSIADAIGATNGAGTGISLYGAATGIGIYGNTTGITTQNTGTGASVENRPPYYALCYIMYTG